VVDRDKILQETDLLALVERDLGPALKQSGRWYFWRCPFHASGGEKRPSLAVTPDNGRWKCFSGSCELSGNVIDWVMQREGLGFLEACARLGGMDLPQPTRVVSPRCSTIRNGPPGEVWQAKAEELLAECQGLLWRDVGERALAYLRGRGFLDETIVDWGIGFQPQAKRYESLEDWGFEMPQDGKRHRMWIPRGLVVPCFDLQGDELLYLKFRRSSAEYERDGLGKYIKLKGSVTGLCGADLVRSRKVLVIEEGEFNAMTIHQEASDLVDVVSTGTASVRPETLEPWYDLLMAAEQVIVRLDPDAAAKGKRWREWCRRVRTIQVPTGKDPNDYMARHEGDVRAWLELELTRLAEGRQ